MGEVLRGEVGEDLVEELGWEVGEVAAHAAAWTARCYCHLWRSGCGRALRILSDSEVEPWNYGRCDVVVVASLLC